MKNYGLTRENQPFEIKQLKKNLKALFSFRIFNRHMRFHRRIARYSLRVSFQFFTSNLGIAAARIQWKPKINIGELWDTKIDGMWQCIMMLSFHSSNTRNKTTISLCIVYHIY